MQLFGKRLAQARKARQWPQEELARQSSVGQNQISRLENGEKPSVSIHTLVRLAAALDCSVDYLVGLTAEPRSSAVKRSGLAARGKAVVS